MQITAFIALFSVGAISAPAACAPASTSNGSAVCLTLAVQKGELVAVASAFAPSPAYAKNNGAAFIQMAKGEIAKLPRPCLLLFAKGAIPKPDANPLPAFCNTDSAWPAFRDNVVAINPDLLSEGSLFRPLVIAYHHSPLLWSDNNASLDAENGTVTFFVADPVDPRTNDTFQIEIKDAPDDATRDRRIARLRQALSPLRGQVFCHDRLRAFVTAFYNKEKRAFEIIQLDPQAPLLIIQEKP